MIIEKNKLKKMMKRSLFMGIIISFMFFCFEALAMVLVNSWENIIILLAGFVFAFIIVLFLIYYNNIITIYKVEYGSESVKFEDLSYNRTDNVRRDSKEFRDKDFWKTVDFSKI